MFSLLRNLVVLTLLCSSFAFANEGGGEAKAEGKEGKAEGGEAKAEAGKEAKDEYGEVQGKVTSLQAKIKSNHETIEKLIEEKQHASDAAKVAEIIKSLVTEHKAMEKNIEEYEKSRSYLQYRFPEKGLKGKRTYERFELKSLEEMEHEMTMDTRIKKTLQKVRKQYVAPEPATKDLKPSKTSPPKNEEPAISEPVILTK